MSDCLGIPSGNIERKVAFSHDPETVQLENPLAVKLLLEELLSVKVTINQNNLGLPIINGARWQIDAIVKLLS